ncbi:hypothetical protein HKCCE4037_08795 [Rhodobacterales bacterium HKCCE4037]|nr:hypothetical protein [Rhodobacterales bacterium HKCCE4037]
MKRVILHAGLPKTGSTSIQSMLCDRADELAELGICVMSRTTTTRQVSRAARTFLNNKAVFPAFLWAALKLRLAIISQSCTTILVSNENLLGLYSSEMFGRNFENRSRLLVNTLLLVLRGCDVSIVLYDRDASSLHRSALKQRWNKSKEISEDEWYRKFPDPLVPSRYIEAMKTSFPGLVECVRMEDEISAGHYLGERLLEMSGASVLGPPQKTYHENVGSPSPKASERDAIDAPYGAEVSNVPDQ